MNEFERLKVRKDAIVAKQFAEAGELFLRERIEGLSITAICQFCDRLDVLWQGNPPPGFFDEQVKAALHTLLLPDPTPTEQEKTS